VSRLTRTQFISFSYRFFILNLLIFYALLSSPPDYMQVWVGRVFYVWTSVFNLFVVSVFWALMADLFSSAQGKRIFGFVAFGGTFGGIVGSALTAGVALELRPAHLLVVTMLLLEGAVWCMKRLSSTCGSSAATRATAAAVSPTVSAQADGENALRQPSIREPAVIGGSIWAGISGVLKSSFLLGISSYMLLFTVLATFLYFQQAEIIDQYSSDRGLRTALFARIDLAVNCLAVFTQLFLTGRVIRWIGLSLTLGLIPILCIFGFSALSLAPTLTVLVVFQILRRSGNYALSRPSREVLYTVLNREDKYKAKNFLDTFVYRLGDQIGAWAYALFIALGMGPVSISLLAVPLSGLWLTIALWLGYRQSELAKNKTATTA
jgi:AAA family ATP:ADP antiporter